MKTLFEQIADDGRIQTGLIANAQLIATAPELLEAAEKLIEAMNQKSFFMDGYLKGSASISEVNEASANEHKAYCNLFDAIKKAKGE